MLSRFSFEHRKSQGDTAGQIVKLLRVLGIMEVAVRDPIRAMTEVMELGQFPNGTPVFQNRLAYESDGVVIDRINTHICPSRVVWKAVCAK
ncbi:hypothetical protein BSK33_15305 [Geobacillus sp. 44B]|jgi:hypothetical protein|nr:hypothetical protein BSK33_15305 [Geobacillus sp. 44B]